MTAVGGAGNVGSTVARCIADKELADVVIVDIAGDKAAGVALDMRESCPITGSDSHVIGWSDYSQTANSDVVVVTSGVPRKPGMSRDDLLNVNFGIMKAVTAEVVKYSPNCIIVPVANPLDAMCQAACKLSGFPRERVIGMAGVLDSARMRTFIMMELNVSGGERACVRPGRARRYPAAPTLFDGRWRARRITELMSRERASTRSASGPPTWRRRDYKTGRDERLGENGAAAAEMVGVHPHDKKKISAVLGVP